MVGLAKFSEKERRKLRRQFKHDRMAQELESPKYRQRILNRKRLEDDESLYDETYDEEED